MPTGDIQQKTLRDLKKKLRDSFFRKKQQHDLYKFWGLCFFFGKSVTKLFFFLGGGGDDCHLGCSRCLLNLRRDAHSMRPELRMLDGSLADHVETC